MTRKDAIAIFQSFFRDPIYHEGSRKYRFRIEGLSKDTVAELHRELYRDGSDITKNEILSFIDQNYYENQTPYLHLPLKYLLPGELLRVVHHKNGEIMPPMLCMKLSSTHFLIWMEDEVKQADIEEGIIRVEEKAVAGEQLDSPFIKETKVIGLQLLPPPIQFRYIDGLLLSEDYVETGPASALKLYSKLLEAHTADRVTGEWSEILAIASISGISTYSIFKILDFLSKNDKR